MLAAHLDPMLGDNWKKRRLWMKLVLIWMVANAQYIILLGTDNALMQNALVTLLGVITAILGSYVFGAVWDDRNKRETIQAVSPGADGTIASSVGPDSLVHQSGE